MSARSLALSLTLLVTLSACKSDPPVDAQAAEEAEARANVPTQLEAVNGEVPDALKAELVFEVQEVDDGNILALVPKGWTTDFMPGRFEPASATLGERVSYSVGSNCDGTCTKKEWGAIIEKHEFGDSVPKGLTVELDELLDGSGGRIKVFTGGDEVFVRAARWLPESNRYFACKADLRGPSATAKQAFIHACKTMYVLDWD